MFEEDLLARIRADGGLTALVGARSHWGERPRGGALPAVVLHLISPDRAYAHGGAVGLAGERVQFDCLGETLAAALGVARALPASLEPLEVVGGTSFKAAFLAGGSQGDPTTDPDGRRVHRVTRDFIIWHQPA